MLLGERWRFALYAGLGMLFSPVFLCIARMRRLSARAPERACVLVVPIMTRVGDIVCATPVFRAIKQRYPQSHLTVLAAKNVADIIRSNPRIDELIVMNNPPFKGVSGRGRLFLFLFRKRFDYAISLANNPFGSLTALWSAAPVRIKTIVHRCTLVEWVTDWWNNYRLLYEHGSFLQDHYLRLLEPLGISASKPVKEVFTTEVGECAARKFLSDIGGAPIVGMTVTAGNRVKEWGAKNFATLADRISRVFGAKIIFIDSANNAHSVQSVIQMMGEKESAVAATVFSLEELPSLIKRLSLFVAVDTGVIYIAHALGVPLIDIIGPVEPNEQPPKDAWSVQVLPPPPHIPSSFVMKRPGTFTKRRAAIEAVSVEAVYAACDKLLRQKNINPLP